MIAIDVGAQSKTYIPIAVQNNAKGITIACRKYLYVQTIDLVTIVIVVVLDETVKIGLGEISYQCRGAQNIFFLKLRPTQLTW